MVFGGCPGFWVCLEVLGVFLCVFGCVWWFGVFSVIGGGFG